MILYSKILARLAMSTIALSSLAAYGASENNNKSSAHQDGNETTSINNADSKVIGQTIQATESGIDAMNKAVNLRSMQDEPGNFEFGATSYSINKNGGVVEITINRVGGSDGTVTVDWMTQGITATFTQDYGSFNWRTLIFADGETSKVETIPIVNIDMMEGDEVFNVLLGRPAGGASLGLITITAVTIANNDNTSSPSSILSKSRRYSRTVTTLAGEVIPHLNEWESAMLEDGEHWGQYLTNLHPAPGYYIEQNTTYYDSQRVFYQIAEYTGEQEPWHTYALESKRVYLNYIENAISDYSGKNFSFPGYRRFAQGLYMEYALTSDADVYVNIAKMRDNPAFSRAATHAFIPQWYQERHSREIAYALEAHVFSERAGYGRHEADVARYLSMALKHIDEWVTGEFGYPTYRRAPFMFGLTAEALILFYEWELENGRDPTALYGHASVPAEFVPTIAIPEAIKSMADYLRDEAIVISGVNTGKPMWVEDIAGRNPNWTDEGGTGYSTFRYEDINNSRPTVDLNLLIAPVYAWLFQHYGEMKYINIADQLFATGVTFSNTRWNTKIFNQNYRWSFDYIKWRNEGFAKMN